MDYSDFFQVDATLVANEFLDRYMPAANGEYVKVYLYLLRNRVGGIDISTIAENLRLTEGDVRRALRYWEEQGILTRGADSTAGKRSRKKKAAPEGGALENTPAGGIEPGSGSALSLETGDAPEKKDAAEALLLQRREREALRESYKRAAGAEKLERLTGDTDFAQLLFVVQKYRSKILTEHDEQVFAYLYDGLKMPCDVLEYLVEYCVQTGHSSMRYIETVGLDWVSSGIRDVEAAKQRTRQFEKDRAESGKRRASRREKLGITRDTDYNSVFSERSNVILEQVIKKQMER